MLVSVDGVNPFFKERTIEIVEGLDFANFRYTTVEGQMPTSVVFECDSEDENLVIPGVKWALRMSDIGALMLFRVVPYGQLMWFRKKD